MRILIDLQGAQTGSRLRGIGRYSTAITRAIIRNRGDHDVFLLLNGLLDDTIDHIIDEFSSILPADHIVAFFAPSPVESITAENAWRREAAELIREWMINELAPDVLLITSIFEGPTNNSITSIRRLETSVKTAVILYDLIPFPDPKIYFPDSAAIEWYYSKIDFLRRADLLLAISDSARGEAVDMLCFDASRTVTIYSAADERFAATTILPEAGKAFLERIGIQRKFIMHVSAFEPRKNFEGLIRAFGLLPEAVRENHQLVLVTAHDPDSQNALLSVAGEAGLRQDELVLLGYIPDNELVTLYSLCTLFVFPSFHEGFGLPALEAMCCGAAVIGSNTTSIPEVIGREDALFDPHSDQSVAELMQRALTDEVFRKSLKTHALQQSKRFSWDRSAKRALQAIEGMAVSGQPRPGSKGVSTLLDKIAALEPDVSPSRQDLIAVSQCIAINRDAARELNPELSQDTDNWKDKIVYSEFDHRRFMTADTCSEENEGWLPLSCSEVEVIHRDVWLRNDRPHILLLKLDHIGDFILTLDAFRLIRDTWPKAHITLVCGPWNKSIAERSGLFDSVHCCNFYPNTTADYDKEAVMKQGLAEYHSLDLGVYDLAVDLRCYDDNRMLLSYTNARYRAGYAAEGVPLDLALPVGPETGMMAHIGARTTALAAAVAWTFGTPPGEARDGILNGRAPARFFKDGIVVGISPGTRNPIRSWGRERFAELAHILHCKGNYRFVLIGGADDRADTQFIGQLLPKSDFVDLTGTLAIADVPPVFAGLDLFIGGETGTTHMAAMMGIPTVCIFSGQTNVNSWRPVGGRVVTLRGKVACAPCYLATIAECPWNLRCMDVPPSLVAAEAVALCDRYVHIAESREPMAI